MTDRLDIAFALAKQEYPDPVRIGKSTYLLRSARLESGADHWGDTLIMQEWRGFSLYPYNHWGFRVEFANYDERQAFLQRQWEKGKRW